ncbi:MAG: hypothetical protein ABIQ73_27510 [Acidimicrobiales bacterium]
MKEATSRWLKPLQDAVRAADPSGDTYERLFRAALMPGVEAEQTLGVREAEAWAVEIPEAKHWAIDWIRFGQILREELGWDDYPLAPLDFGEDN